MTLPVVPGSSMSFSQINTELGLSSTTTISLNQANVRTLAGVGASPATIAITNLSGKSNQFAFTISTNQTNANLATLGTAAGWNGSSKLIATVNSGIYISSNATGTPALTVSGSFPGGAELINGGIIVGMGGAGGRGATGGVNGGGGGTALSVSSAISINNTGTIAGGGGGGAGGGAGSYSDKSGTFTLAGGGGGGGRSSFAANSAGGAVGSGGNPAGGLAPGGAGTVSGPGGGGNGAQVPSFFAGAPGGAGGSGGGWGAAGGTSGGSTNGAAGAAVSGNGNITWIAFGTRLGPIA